MVCSSLYENISLNNKIGTYNNNLLVSSSFFFLHSSFWFSSLHVLNLPTFSIISPRSVLSLPPHQFPPFYRSPPPYYFPQFHRSPPPHHLHLSLTSHHLSPFKLSHTSHHCSLDHYTPSLIIISISSLVPASPCIHVCVYVQLYCNMFQTYRLQLSNHHNIPLLQLDTNH